jgi:uncharacterized protein YdeI (YjbR/CyaY-like superfamily)
MPFRDVDDYIAAAKLWPSELAALRPILLDAGLTESIKWAKPCYSQADANIAIMQEMKGFLALMFFKGALLNDPEDILESQGPNSRSALRVCFRSVEDVERLEAPVRALIESAIDAERRGLEVGPAPEPEWADALTERLADDDRFREAFERLTPGRQREYNLHFASAKQYATRQARVAKYAPQILAGLGMRDS